MKNVKANNKGFSLVELIIVIAIMAILIGVLAPQYMKYVEKSRVSADKDLLDSVYNACTTAYADPDLVSAANYPAVGSGAVTITKGDGGFGDAVCGTLGTDIAGVSSQLKSKSCKGKTPTINIDADGNFTVSCGDITIPEVKKAASGS